MQRKIKILLLLIFTFLFSSFVSADLSTDLFSYYYLNNTGTISDEVGTRDGTLTGGSLSAGINENGIKNFGSLAFSGSFDIFSGSSNFTTNLWIKGNHTGSNVYGYDMRKEHNHFMFINTVNDFAQCGGTDGSFKYAISTTDVMDNTWHMVTCVYDTSINQMRIYVDGVNEDNETIGDFTVGAGVDNTLGSDNTGGANFPGVHDEFMVWNDSKNSSEISDLYNGGIGNFYPFVNITPPNISINESVESTAIVKQVGTATLIGLTPQTIFSSNFNVSVNDTDIYGGYNFNVFSNLVNVLFCELYIDGVVVKNVTRTQTANELGSVNIMSEVFSLDSGVHNQSLVCEKVSGGGQIVISNSVGVGHFLVDERNNSIPHTNMSFDVNVNNGTTYKLLEEINFTISDNNNTNDENITPFLVVEWTGEYSNNFGSREVLFTYLNITTLDGEVNSTCSFYPRSVDSGGIASVSGDCLIRNATTNANYTLRFYGNGTNANYNIGLVAKEFYLNQEEIAGGTGFPTPTSFSSLTRLFELNNTGNLNHGLTNVFEKVAFSIKADSPTTAIFYVKLVNSTNFTTINFTRSVGTNTGVLIGHDILQNVGQDNYVSELWADCGGINCTIVGGDGIGYVTDITSVVLNAFNISVFDNFDNSSISNFTVVNGAEFSTNTGSLLYFSEDDFVNFTVTSDFNGGYFSFNVLNHNVSNDLNVSLNQTEIKWDCFEKVSGINLNCSSPSENIIFNYNVVGNPHTQSLNVSGYFENFVTFNVGALDNKTLNATNFFSSKVNYTTTVLGGGGSPTNCTFNTTSLDYTFSSVNFTTNGSLNSLGLINGSYNVIFDCVGYAINNFNFTVDDIYESFNLELYTTNSINLFFYNSDTGSFLNNTNITVEFIGSTKQTNNTNNGSLYVDLLSPDTYTIISSAEGFRETSYLITVLNRSTQNISIYLQPENTSQLVLVTVRDRVSSIRIAGAEVIIQRYLNDSWITDQILSTDFQGNSEGHFVVSTVFYNFLVKIDGVLFFGVLNGDENKKNIYAEDVTNGLIIQIDTNPNNVITDYQNLYDVVGDVTVTRLSNFSARFRFSWNDPTGSSRLGELKVYKSGVLVNTSSAVTSNGVVFVTVSVNDTEGLVGFTAVGSVDGEIKDNSGIILGNDELFSLAWGVFGYFLAFLILVILAFGFADNPPLALMFSSIAFVGMIVAQIVFKGIDIAVWSFIIVSAVFIARIPKKLGGV